MPETVHDVTLGGTTLKQCEAADYMANAEAARHRASGAPAAALIRANKAEPVARFQSGDLQGVIAAMLASVNALHVAAGSIVIPYKKRATGGTYEGSSAHFTLSGTHAMNVCTEISATHQDPKGAMATVETHFYSSDGLTEPVAENTGQSVSTESFNRAYALGECDVNGSAIEFLVSARVITGKTVVKAGWAPGLYPQKVWIEEIDPKIELTFEDFDAMASYSALFAAMTSAAVHFRRLADAGSYVAALTAEHARFSLGAGLWVAQGLSAKAQARGQATIVLEGKTLTSSAASAVALSS